MFRRNLRATLRTLGAFAGGVICGLPLALQAGGSGLNTIVVVNQTSSNSCALGNYYCERRQVPAENVLRINWATGNRSWTAAEFQASLLTPLTNLLADHQLTNQVDYVVLSMDIPFQTLNGSDVNSTTAALFYGLKVSGGGASAGLTNSYAASEQVFRQARPASAPGFSALATMITANSLAQARQLVDQGVNSDGTFPTQPVLLEKSSDRLRNIRFRTFDNAIFNLQLGLNRNYNIVRTNSDAPGSVANLLGLQTGLADFSIPANTFVPGAMADSLTSFGGIIFGPNDQTTALAFIAGGAAGSYGTVTEPSPMVEKFPNPQNYFYQSRGFSLAECYYQSLRIPYQGLIVGEPLAAPCRIAASGSWQGVGSNTVLQGIVPLSVQFTAADANHPVQQLDWFVDGRFVRVLTNLPPQPGNALWLNLGSTNLNYIVPVGADLARVATDLAALVNANTNATKTLGVAYGDRIEMQSLAPSRPRAPLNLRTEPSGSATNVPAGNPFTGSSVGTAGALTTWLTPSRGTFADSTASGIRAVTVNGTLQLGTWLQITVTKAAGSVVTVSATNESASGTPFTLASNLVTQINATANLQGWDGLVAEDLAAGFYDAGQFNLRARAPGLSAAKARIAFSTSGSLVINPATEVALNENLTDLRPRNHLYLTAGATELAHTFLLDTAALPDGFHDLAVVAYEGSHVRTQTRLTLPVRIQNTALEATLTPLDLADGAPAAGTYHVQVAANTNTIATMRLYTTGGELAAVTNQSISTFNVSGAYLGAGLHPFYAMVQTADGRQYRTATRWIRLTP
jgi:uncharacterized protein (TIGR03790 family)